MVIAARGEEQGTGIAADGDVEAQPAGIELLGIAEVRDVQMHVPDARPGLHAAVRCTRYSDLRDQAVQVERQRRHLKVVAVVAPLRPRPITVDLDAVVLGIAEVERLADEVIRGTAQPPAGTNDVRERPGERCPPGYEDREVEQPGRAGWARAGGGARMELHHRRPVHAEPGDLAVDLKRLKSDHPLVTP